MTVTYVHDLVASKVSAISSKLLTDHEGESHRARCEKRPSQCMCPGVHWIWASRPEKSEPVRSGKWMLFPSTMYVDSTWEKVKDLLASGKIGSSAKVAPLSHTNNKSHLICIYTNDHEDVADVFRVLVVLRQNQIATSPIHYKTDEATYEGLYATSSAAAVAGFTVPAKKPKNYRVSKYSAPKINETGTKTDLLKSIKMYLNNIGPKLHQGIVAEFTVPSAIQSSNQLKRKFDEMDGSQSGKGGGEHTPIELHLVATILDPPRLI